MEPIRRLNTNPTAARADGVMAPLNRLSAHLGYCAHAEQATETPEAWERVKPDVLADLRLSLEHMQDMTYSTPFLSADAQAAISTLKRHLEEFLDEDMIGVDKGQFNEWCLTMMHNAAYVGTRMEYDATGYNAQEGMEL